MHDPSTTAPSEKLYVTSVVAEKHNKLKKLVEQVVQYGDFTLSSGKSSNFYFDGRQITLSSTGMWLVGGVIVDMLQRTGIFETVTAVGGPTSGADPIACATVLNARLDGCDYDAFFVRKEAKGHGTGRLIEGPALGPHSRVVIVEDVVTTGGSLIRAAEAVKGTGATILQCIALLDREEGASEAFDAAELPFSPIFRRSELARTDN